MTLTALGLAHPRHCEERSDAAIPGEPLGSIQGGTRALAALDRRAPLAMTKAAR